MKVQHGLKTGSTSLALYNLSASATRNGLSLIAVIMKAPSTKVRFSEAQKLLDYGFSNYTYKELGKKDDFIKNVSVTKGIESETTAIFKDNIGVLLKKGEDKNIAQNLSIAENLSAPIVKGQKIGEVSFTLNGNIIGKSDIISNKEIKKNSLMNMVSHLYKIWFCILR